jgi:hypothetical protein
MMLFALLLNQTTWIQQYLHSTSHELSKVWRGASRNGALMDLDVRRET